MMVRLKEYLLAVESALKAGNATEHTHRPALKALLESPQVTARYFHDGNECQGC
jgi:hypothetical protein